MSQGIFAVTAFLAAACVLAVGQAARADDDCAVLEQLVRAGVQTATTFRVDRAMPPARFPEGGGAVGSTMSGRQLCASTAEATSRAFRQALAALDISVTWTRSTGPGPDCPARDLRQCHPSPHPLAPALTPGQLAFVQHAWAGVRNTVASRMPYGTPSDFTEFTSASFVSALSSNLDRSRDFRFEGISAQDPAMP